MCGDWVEESEEKESSIINSCNSGLEKLGINSFHFCKNKLSDYSDNRSINIFLCRGDYIYDSKERTIEIHIIQHPVPFNGGYLYILY